MKLLPMNHISHHFVACCRLMDFAACSAGPDRPREHQYIDHVADPITWTSPIPRPVPFGPVLRFIGAKCHCWLHFTSHRDKHAHLKSFSIVARQKKPDSETKDLTMLPKSIDFVSRMKSKTCWKRKSCSPYYVPLSHAWKEASKSSKVRKWA